MEICVEENIEKNIEICRSYVSLDLETTGLNPKLDKIIEIGAVKVLEGKITQTFETFVNPGRILSEKVKTLTGIQDENLCNAPFTEDCIQELLDFMEDLPLLGHSVLFDFSFVKRAAVNTGRTLEKEGIDTLAIARNYLQELESRNLGFLCKHFQIPHEEHRALGDAMATHFLYGILCEKFYPCSNDGTNMESAKETKDSKIFQPKKLIYQVKKESPITKHQKMRLYELIEQHKLMVDYQVEHLTRNEASRYIDKILATYGRWHSS